MSLGKNRSITFYSSLLLLSACGSEQALLPVQRLDLQTPCDIMSYPCTVSGEGISLEISFSEKLQALVPFQVNLHLISGDPEKIKDVTAAFSMEGMQMGINRYRFLPTTTGNWSAQVTLPICVTGRSDWMIDVEMETAKVRQRFEVPFVLEKH